ncbi:DUF2269 domain-containing protein [Kitasatospora cineracea]
MPCLLTLAVRALPTDDAGTVRTAYRAMAMPGDAPVVPPSPTSLASGVVLALGTRWGLFRFRWVAVKFWLTPAATAASVLALTARPHEAARAAERHPTGSVPAVEPGFPRYHLAIVPTVALLLHLADVVLSVFKPWGRRPERRPAR